MDTNVAVTVHLGRTLQRVLRTFAVLLAVSALAVPLTAQLLAIDDGVPPAARWLVSVLLWTVVAGVLRTPLTEPATALRNRHRLEAFPWVIAAGAAALQLVEPTPVMALLLLLAGSVAATFLRTWSLVALTLTIAAVQVLATALAAEPDWLLTIGVITVLTLMTWSIAMVSSSHHHAIRLQVEARAREQTYVQGLTTVMAAAESLHTRHTDVVLKTILDTTDQLGWDRAGLYLTGDDVELGSRQGYREDVVEEPGARGARRRAELSGDTVVMDDYAAHPDSDPVHHDLSTVVAVPVRVGGEVIGALTVGRREGSSSTGDVRLVELLGRQASCALEMAAQFREQDRAIEDQRALTALKDDFLGTVSHELRTPLHVVLGMAETLDQHWERLDEEDRHDLVGRMHRNASGLKTVIESLLDLSRLDAGQVALQHDQIDLVAIAHDVTMRATELAPEHHLRVEGATDGAMTAWADAALVERVLDNLITNAVLHTPPGTSIVTRIARDAERCVVEVADDGPGIAPADVDRLTERFFRAGDPLHRDTRGLGLGLPFCAEVLTLHGSRLDVTATPGGGATFSFALPVRAPDSAQLTN